MRRRPGAVAGAIVVSVVTLLALAAIEWGEPRRSTLSRAFRLHAPQEDDRSVIPPSAPDGRHLLGTDSLGRDLLSRLLHGARVSLFVGVSAEAIALLCGLVVGALSGYAGGRMDAVLMRATDVLLAFPVPLMAMGAMAVFDTPSVMAVFVVLGLVLARFAARLWRRWLEAAGVALMIGTVVSFLIVQEDAKRDLRVLMSAECIFGFLVGCALLGIGLVKHRSR